MKTTLISIKNPCSEKWDSMKTNEKGRFCSSCSKTVVDFSTVSKDEIRKHLKENKKETCGRFRQSQLEEPYITQKTTYQFKLPYKNIAAGLLIASSLSLTPPCNVEPREVCTTHVSDNRIPKATKKAAPTTYLKPTIIDSSKTTIIKGMVSELDSTVINNAKISFISLNEVITTHSDKKGKFSMEIPSYLITKKNVFRTTFNDIIEISQPGISYITFRYFKTNDNIINKSNLDSEIRIIAEPDPMVLGGLGLQSYNQQPPIVIHKGKEVDYKEFQKEQEGKKSSCNFENTEFYYFDGDAAIALYGEKAKHGLYLSN